jgi:MoaA/NifB/PqqE/SkfB family radical SAM enzyme
MINRRAVEYNLTEHCNLKCANCDHNSPHAPSAFASVEEFRDTFSKLAQVLTLKELKLVGGEPLLHPELLRFLDVAREIGIAQILTVITNGVLLNAVSEEFWSKVDRVVVSIYPGVKYKYPLESLKEIAAKHNVQLWLKESPNFRLTMLNNQNHDSSLVREIYQRCRITHIASCHTIIDGRYFKCSPAPFVRIRLGLKGVQFDNYEHDGVRIAGNPDLENDLRRYLESEEPLDACAHCLGSVGKVSPNEQLSKIRLRAEIEQNHEDVRDLIDWELFAAPWVFNPKQVPNVPTWIADELEESENELRSRIDRTEPCPPTEKR